MQTKEHAHRFWSSYAAYNMQTMWHLCLSLLLVVLMSNGTFAAEQCQNDYTFVFKPSLGPGGTASFITASSTDVPVFPFVDMPPIILLFTLRRNGDVDLTLDGTLVQAVASPLLRLGGAAVQLTQGQAIFRALQIQQQPEASSINSTTITFSIVVPFGNTTATYTLRTPPLRVLTAAERSNPLVHITFGNYGLFFRPGQVMDLSTGADLPGFTLMLKDSLGNLASSRRASVAISVKGSNGLPLVGASVVPANVNLTGSADIRSIRIIYTGTAPSITGAILRFEATTIDAVGPPTTSVVETGTINLKNTDSTVRFIRFDPAASFFPANNIGNTAVLGTSLPPIVVQVVNNLWEVDTGFQDVVIVAKSDGAALEGDAALVINGHATFADLKFVNFAPKAAVITFTAALSSSMVRTLFSGTVSVSKAPIKARHLSFAADSTVQTEKRATSGGLVYLRRRTDLISGGSSVLVSLLSVLVLDSAYQPDYSARGVELTVSLVSTDTSVDPPVLAFPFSQSSMTVQQGFAKIRNLELFVSAQHEVTPFIIRVEDASGIRPRLDSAAILVIKPLTTDLSSTLVQCRNVSLTCGLSLSFVGAPLSYVTEVDGPVTATIGALIPEIRVYVNDAAGPIDPLAAFPSSSASLYAYTTNSPANEDYLSSTGASSLAGVWSGAYFSFPCLKLAVAPSRLVRLYFGFFYSDAVTAVLTPIHGISTIRTAFITVAKDTTGNFDIEFLSSSTSYLTYRGQSGHAVIGVAMPTIQIRVIDSLGNPDASSNGGQLLLGVSSSAGDATMDDSLVPFANGVATISSLRFLSHANSPTLTFTIQPSTIYPRLSRQSIQSGPIALSVFPTDAVSLAIRPFEACNSSAYFCVSGVYEELTFATLGEALLRVQLGVKDSSSEWSTPSSDNGAGTFRVQASCDQAEFSASQPSEASGAIGHFLDFRVPPMTRLKAAFESKGAPIYVTLRVVDAPDHPALLDASVTVGPIHITAFKTSSASSTCAGAASAPIVVIKLYTPSSRVAAAEYLRSELLDPLCFIMGVEKSRLAVVEAPRITSGVSSDTGRWEGTRIGVQFSDPTPTSSNRDSAVSLAAALVALRPDCQAPNLNIASIFYASTEKGCELDAFRTAVSDATECARRGFYTTCQCFQDNVVSPMGVVCSIDVVVRSEFSTMCQRLADCQQSEIISVCEDALENTSNKYVWAFAAFGGALGCGMVVYVFVKKVFLRRKPAQLHKDDS